MSFALIIDIYWLLVCFVFGSVVGSFLNVVIARVPYEESVVSPPSRCPSCSSPIRWYDNIPLVSYIILGGKCRRCSAAISFRYPGVELITAGLFSATYLVYDLTVVVPVVCVFCAAMVAVFFIDLDFMIIPDSITLNLLPIGLSASIAQILPFMNWKLSFMGLVLGGAILYFPGLIYEKIRGIEGMGGGDVKLMAAIGSFFGPVGVVFVLFVSSLAGSIVGLSAMALKHHDSTTAIPYGPFLATAAVIYALVGPASIEHLSGVSLWVLMPPWLR